jgi:hypothetical protein
MVDWNMAKTEMDSLEFVNLREQMKADDGASFSFDRVRLTTDAGQDGSGEVITLIDTVAGNAAAVWVTPYPDAKFEQDPAQTDGARLGRALARCFGTDDASKDDVVAIANEKGGTLTVSKNDYGESWAWLWEVSEKDA